MSDSEHPGRRLLRDLHDFEERYDSVKDELSADDTFALWSALWRLSENIIVDHRQLKAAERKRQRLRR